MARQNRHTVYDKMEYDGVFDKNPANAQARDNNGLSIYKGPVEFPKMLYHPEGKQKITRPAEAIATPFGPKLVGEEKMLISMTVENKEEELAALKDGWHTRPRDAHKARAEKTGEELEVVHETVHESEIDKLRKQLEAAEVRNAELEMVAATGKPVPPKKA